MSQSKRTAILEQMKTIALTAATLGGRAYRSRTAAFNAAQSPALCIRPADETVNSQLGDDISERDFHVQFIFIGRGDIPDDECEQAFAEVHTLICADPSFGGLATELFEDSTHWTFIDGAPSACEMEVRYRIRLYTPANDITQNLM